MAKSGKFGKVAGKVASETKANIEAKKDEFVDKLKEDPFSVLDATAIVEFINDPVGVLGNTVTDPEFIGAAIGMALDCVPVVGPVLSNIFSKFWPKDPKQEAVTAEELDKKLVEFKKEMEEIMDKKISESEVKTWKNICEAFFKGLTANMEVLKEKIAVLKIRLSEGEAKPELKTYIRDALEDMRVQIKVIIQFCASNAFLEDTTKYYMDCLFIYIVVMRHLDSFWFQLGVDEYFVTGRPEIQAIEATEDSEAIKGSEEVKSFRERVDLVLTQGINDIAIGASRNFNKGKDDQNKPVKEYGSKLFKLNQLRYPVKLIEHPEQIRRLYTDFHDRYFVCTPITLPAIKTAYIYRVDGAMFYPRQGGDYLRGGRVIPDHVEPITGCIGGFNALLSNLPFKLPSKRVVHVRVFGIRYHQTTALSVNGKFLPDKLDVPLKCVDVNIEVEGVTCGFTSSEKFYTDEIKIQFEKIDDEEPTMEHMEKGIISRLGEAPREKILFVEVIVHDESEDGTGLPASFDLIPPDIDSIYLDDDDDYDYRYYMITPYIHEVGKKTIKKL